MIFWNDINWEKLFADYGVKFESVSDDAKPINYYNPIRLFTEPDVDGEFAGVAITCSNRSAGKTSAFAAASCILCKEYGLQTGWIFRTKGEMTGAAAMYEDMLQMYPKLGSVITYKNLDKNGNVVRYFLDGEPFGCAFSFGSKMDSVKNCLRIFGISTFCFLMSFPWRVGNM